MRIGYCKADIFLACTSLAIFIATLTASKPYSSVLISLLVVTILLSSITVAIETSIYGTLRRKLDGVHLPSQRSSLDELPLRLYSYYKTLHYLFTPSAQVVKLFHAGSTALLALILIRILAVENFGGHPANLDFGIKGGKDDSNLAFTVGLGTVGHFLQGLLAAFLSFPAVAGMLARLVKKGLELVGMGEDEPSSSSHFLLVRPNLPTLIVVSLASACMTVYQSYNLVKRIYYYDNFSRSSYWSNGLEWAFGYVIGVALGRLVSKVVMRILLLGIGMDNIEELKNIEVASVDNDDEIEDTKYGFGKVTDYTKDNLEKYLMTMPPFLILITRIFNAISMLLLIGFSLSILVAAIELGNSWNMCEDDDEVCGDGSVSTPGLLVSFLVVYGVVYGLFGCGYDPLT